MSSPNHSKAIKWLAISVLIVCALGWLVLPFLYTLSEHFMDAHAKADSEGGTFIWGMIQIFSSVAFLIVNSLALMMSIGSAILAHRRNLHIGFLNLLALICPFWFYCSAHYCRLCY